MTNTSSSSLRSFHIYRKLNRRRESKFSMKRKGQYSGIVFCVKNNSVLHPFISYNTVKDVSF